MCEHLRSSLPKVAGAEVRQHRGAEPGLGYSLLESGVSKLRAGSCAQTYGYWTQPIADAGLEKIPFGSDRGFSALSERRFLRKEAPRQWITHNMMGFAPTVNYFDLAKDLDFVSHDQYPGMALLKEKAASLGSGSAASLDIIRAIKEKTFWIMEQQSSITGWGEMSRMPRAWPAGTVGASIHRARRGYGSVASGGEAARSARNSIGMGFCRIAAARDAIMRRSRNLSTR